MSDIRFNCPHCEQSLEADADMAGETIECPGCGMTIRVPVNPVGRSPELAGMSHPDTSATARCQEMVGIRLNNLKSAACHMEGLLADTEGAKIILSRYDETLATIREAKNHLHEYVKLIEGEERRIGDHAALALTGLRGEIDTLVARYDGFVTALHELSLYGCCNPVRVACPRCFSVVTLEGVRTGDIPNLTHHIVCSPCKYGPAFPTRYRAYPVGFVTCVLLDMPIQPRPSELPTSLCPMPGVVFSLQDGDILSMVKAVKKVANYLVNPPPLSLFSVSWLDLAKRSLDPSADIVLGQRDLREEAIALSIRDLSAKYICLRRVGEAQFMLHYALKRIR